MIPAMKKGALAVYRRPIKSIYLTARRVITSVMVYPMVVHILNLSLLTTHPTAHHPRHRRPHLRTLMMNRGMT